MNSRYDVLILLIRLMKWSVVQWLLLLFGTGLSWANPGEAQEIENRRVTVSAEDQPVRMVLRSLEQQAGTRFMYRQNLLNTDRRISLRASNERLAEVLEKLLKPLNLHYEVLGERILLTQISTNSTFNLSAPKEILSPLALADVRVSGRVTDADGGDGLPGVNVTLKETNRGTTTDATGNYVLTIPDGGGTLIFSFVGYGKREESVGTRTTLNIALTADNKTLNEVIVVGYNTQDRRDITGAVSTVKAEDLKSVPATSFAQQLQGRAAGVQVSNDNSPGGGVAVRIRGIGSITGGNDPLYIIDGVPTQSGLNQLNPNDIESLQILKDASTASIYGARANNGVVIITTKKGKAGRSQVSFDTYTGIQSPRANKQGFVTPQQYADILWQATRNSGQVNPVTGDPVSPVFGTGVSPTIPAFLTPAGAKDGDPFTTATDYALDPNAAGYGISKFQITRANQQGTDWYKEMTRSAPIRSYNLSVSGGSETGRYALSAGYFNQEGIIKFTGFKRYSVRANTEFAIKKRIRIGENLQFSYTDDVSVPLRVEESPLTKYLFAPSIQPVFDIAGNFSGNRNNPIGAQNPYALLVRNKDNHNYIGRMFGNIYAEADIFNFLTLRTSFGVDYQTQNSSAFTETNVEDFIARPQASTLFLSNSSGLGFTWTNTLNYTQRFDDKHRLTLLAGTEAVSQKTSFFNTNKQDFAFDDVDYRYLDAASTVISSNGSAIANSLFSLFAKTEYAYNDRYLFSATVRRDGSSRFAQANRYGTFPALSVGWRISQENFLQNSGLFNELKLRVGWGKTGNQDIDQYNQYSTYGFSLANSSYDISGTSSSVVPGFDRRRIGNPNARWESQTMTNVGLDATLLNNKLDISIDAYNRSVTDLLLVVPVLATDGQNERGAQNIGSMYNRGVDLSLTYRNTAVGNKLTYNITGNWSTYKNEVTQLYQGDDSFISGYDTRRLSTVTRTLVGSPISSYYGYRLLGIFQTQEEASASATQGGNRALYNQPGRFRFADVNGDKVIDSKDQTVIGSPIPKFTYGLNINLGYRGFDLTMFLQGVYGNDLFNYNKYYTDFFGAGTNYGTRLLNAWTPQNPNGILPQLNFNTSGYESQVSSYYVEKGSYFRGKNLQLGYSLPVSLLSKIKVDRTRVYVQAQNLFTVTKYQGLDPEVNLSYYGSGADRDIGVDRGVYPSARTFIVGLQVGF